MTFGSEEKGVSAREAGLESHATDSQMGRGRGLINSFIIQSAARAGWTVSHAITSIQQEPAPSTSLPVSAPPNTDPQGAA